MNYVILIGVALFFVATAIRDGAMGWDFRDDSMNFRIDDGNYSLRSRPTARSISSPTAAASYRCSTGAARSTSHDARRHRPPRAVHERRTARSSGSSSSKATSSRGAPKRIASSPKSCRSCCARRPSTPTSASRGSSRTAAMTGLLDEIELIQLGLRAARVHRRIRADGRDRGCQLRAAHDDDGGQHVVGLRRAHDADRSLRRADADGRPLRRPARGRRDDLVRFRCAHGARARRIEHAARRRKPRPPISTWRRRSRRTSTCASRCSPS